MKCPKCDAQCTCDIYGSHQWICNSCDWESGLNYIENNIWETINELGIRIGKLEEQEMKKEDYEDWLECKTMHINVLKEQLEAQKKITSHYAKELSNLTKQVKTVKINRYLCGMNNGCQCKYCTHTIKTKHNYCPGCGLKIEWIEDENEEPTITFGEHGYGNVIDFGSKILDIKHDSDGDLLVLTTSGLHIVRKDKL